VGEQKNALESAIDGSQMGLPVIKSCSDAADLSFLPDGTTVTSPPPNTDFFKFAGDKSSWIAGWSRKQVDAANLPAPEYLAVAPPPVAWAVGSGLGTVNACFSEFRPSKVAFTTAQVSPWNYVYNAEVPVIVSVEFTPTSLDLAKRLKVETGKSVEVARWSLAMQCKSSYRPEDNRFPGESRMQGVFTHALQAWKGSNVCGAEYGPTNLTQESVSTAESVLNQIRAALGALKAPARQALQTKIQTSGPYQEAMDTYAALSMLVDLRFRPTGYEPSPNIPLTSPDAFVKQMAAKPMTSGKEAEWLQKMQDMLSLQQKRVLDACDNVYRQLTSGTSVPPAALTNVRGVTDRLNRFAAAYKQVRPTGAKH
jgi:hypothetical protein